MGDINLIGEECITELAPTTSAAALFAEYAGSIMLVALHFTYRAAQMLVKAFPAMSRFGDGRRRARVAPLS